MKPQDYLLLLGPQIGNLCFHAAEHLMQFLRTPCLEMLFCLEGVLSEWILDVMK